LPETHCRRALDSIRRNLARGIGLAALAAVVATPAVAAPLPQSGAAPVAAAPYRNFKVAIYVVVGNVRALADRATFDREYARVASQLHFDKVYIEAYRDHQFATDDELAKVSSYFREKGIAVAGGITLAAGGRNGQFGTFDYEDPADRAECERAVRLAARHFDQVILDDFFFFTSKSDANIAAKGKRSWTQYRLDTMRAVARDLVLRPAKAENPNVRMIIKYPNWYEHFQGLGYDLDQEARAFDGIYTGTETRDPVITDQLLQQYESYLVYRYYSNIRPGANGGGWVDTFSTRSLDRYAEQLWDTVFAKAPEITLFNWSPMASDAGADEGERPWASMGTSFDWQAASRAWWRSGSRTPPGWARAAGLSLDAADSVLGALGKPIGVASYKPYQSSGDDFLHNYLGNVGIPIELSPTYPADAKTVVLTEAAAADPGIVGKIQASLKGGATVIVTSGLVAALGSRFADLAEWTPTGRTVAVDHFIEGFGAGNGRQLDDPGAQRPILFPEVRFYTNDSWAIMRGVSGQKGFPILLMNHYSQGTLVMLAIPENPSDLYNLPTAALDHIRAMTMQDFPAYLEAPANVSLFAYDNGAYVVENFRDQPVSVTLMVKGDGMNAVEQPSGTAIGATPPPAGATGARSGWTRFALTLPPHSFRAIGTQK
jgi:hypothetical protein